MNQAQTQKTTRNTTSKSSTPKAASTQTTELATGAITEEDLAFERSLQASVEPKLDIDEMPVRPLQKEKMQNTMLSEFVDNYEPAKTHADLGEQVHLAKEYGADSIEAEPSVIRQLTLKSGYPHEVGYLWYHDVKVWVPNFSEEKKQLLDKETIDAKLFGKSQVAIRAIPEPTEGKK